jgi:hypothetical protein
MPRDPFGAELALALALHSRELHGVNVDGTCRHCLPGTRWPCPYFERAQRVVRVLSAPEPAGFLHGDEYLETAVADMYAAAYTGRPPRATAPPAP